jgi:hydroxymethylbilane synthase
VCLLAERAFLKRLQGGCSVPVFGLATLEGSELYLTGGVVSLDGQELLRVAQSGAAMAAASIGTATAEELLGLGADRILAEIKTKL